MKSKITAFINELILYDYILFASVFTLFILFVILAIVIRKKVGLAIFFVLFAFSILLLGPSFGYIEMHKFLFKNSITIDSQKRLQFTSAIVARATLINESKFDFKSCKVTLDVHKSSKNELRNFLYQFTTIKSMSIVTEGIKKGQSVPIKIIVEPFTYSRDYNLSIGAKCK